MITRVEHISDEQLRTIRQTIGEAFVSNELFHNWGNVDERKNDVIKYMSIYVDYVYQAGELYANEDLTGFIGLEDSAKKTVMLQIKMLLKMLIRLRFTRLRSLMAFAGQIRKSNVSYAKQRHYETLLVCIHKAYQGKGLATELITFAKKKADAAGIPLIFDTDMEKYARMYQYLGCDLYNTVTADNGVTRYSLCYKPREMAAFCNDGK